MVKMMRLNPQHLNAAQIAIYFSSAVCTIKAYAVGFSACAAFQGSINLSFPTDNAVRAL